MENRLNEFDRLIKETYENHEPPYDPGAWDELEEELNATAPGMMDYFKSFTTGLALTGVVFASMLIYFSGNGENSYTEEVKDEPVVAQVGEKMSGSAEGIRNMPESEAEKMSEKPDETATDAREPEPASTAPKKAENDSAPMKEKTDEKMKAVTTDVKASTKAEDGESSTVRKGCTGLTIQFDAPEEYGKDAKYLWNFGDGYFSNEANPSHTFNKEGVFDVSLSVTSLSSGQISSNVVQAMIEVVDAPKAEFDMTVASMNEISMNSTSMQSTKTSWEINGKDKGDGSEINLSLSDNTKYEVRLIATNDGSCIDTLQKNIHVVQAGNQFPKVYSTAHSNEYSPGAIVDNGKVKDFRVFEKSTGKEVFRSSGSKGWNGNTSEGREAPEGEYVWIMVVDSDETVDVYRGSVHLQ
jgi:PKD repeat protein